MPKYYGSIGFSITTETRPGVWTEVLTERKYTGDILRNTRRWENGEHLNDNLKINNMLSIVADAYAYNNFHTIRYIKWYGAAWKVSNVEVNRPRLILTLGDPYNGETAGVT